MPPMLFGIGGAMNPYSPDTYRRPIQRPQSRFSASERRKKQGESDFWGGVAQFLPGYLGAAGGVVGGVLGSAGGPAGTMAGASLGSSLGGLAGQAVGSFPGGAAQNTQRELDEDTQRQDLLYAALADFYRSGM